MAEKFRYWVGILYPENMLSSWESHIADLIQLPFAYCIHDQDLDQSGEDRKVHVHLMIMWSNTTTYKNALSVFQMLSAPGCRCCNEIKRIISPRQMYEYLIHNTEECQKKGKFLYPASARITGNNFDIGAYEQIGIEEKQKIRHELSMFVIDNQICNYRDLYEKVILAFSDHEHEEVLINYSAHFERLCRGNYLFYSSANKSDCQ